MIKKRKILIIVFLLAFNYNLKSQTVLSQVEKEIIELVRQNKKESIDFLEKVVNINSGTLNKTGVKKVGYEFKSAFDKIGFKTNGLICQMK